ncbi:hypothetical protein R3P38DRAFT_3547858, partial [Favolaschia claudopus]
AVVTDVELLRCLRVLSQLDKLFITDCCTSSSDEAVVQPIVTDTFLRGLVLAPGSTPLMPKLRFLSLRCGLNFTDSIYANLLASRVQDRDAKNAFTANLWWFAGQQREISPEALERIAQLVSEGELTFKSGKYEPAIHD